ncbi:hypothetical protein ABZ234_07930 [Nocardiopsis sp. NPDC006198]|uniref:hypothetical protein n=1 Tax=Nocardiopsis sp. NPDC006198 TaxID=3154472 RepID=UPI0033ACAAA2
MEKKQIAFYPGVKEDDIPRLPEAIKISLVERLTELANGTIEGFNLDQDVIATLGKYSCKKVYLTDPETTRQFRKDSLDGKKSKVGADQDGGYRLIYRDAVVRQKPAIVVVSVGPRKGLAAYKTAMHRIIKQETQRQTTTSQKKFQPQKPTRHQENASRRTNGGNQKPGRGL